MVVSPVIKIHAPGGTVSSARTDTLRGPVFKAWTLVANMMGTGLPNSEVMKSRAACTSSSFGGTEEIATEVESGKESESVTAAAAPFLSLRGMALCCSFSFPGSEIGRSADDCSNSIALGSRVLKQKARAQMLIAEGPCNLWTNAWYPHSENTSLGGGWSFPLLPQLPLYCYWVVG